MARGGYRPGAGRPKGATSKKRKDRAVKKDPVTLKVPQDIADAAAAENLTPLDYMLREMNKTGEPKERRDRLAIAAAPFCHPRKGEGTGKKEEKADRAKAAGAGKFAASKPPQLKVVGK